MKRRTIKNELANTVKGCYSIGEIAYVNEHNNPWYKSKCNSCKTELNLSHTYVLKSSLNKCRCYTILQKRKSMGMVR